MKKFWKYILSKFTIDCFLCDEKISWWSRKNGKFTMNTNDGEFSYTICPNCVKLTAEFKDFITEAREVRGRRDEIES